MSAMKVGWEVSNKAPSYFDMMGVLPTASSKEISKGYKAPSYFDMMGVLPTASSKEI